MSTPAAMLAEKMEPWEPGSMVPDFMVKVVSSRRVLQDIGESPILSIGAMSATQHIDLAVGRVSDSGITLDLEGVSAGSGGEGDGREGSDSAPRTVDVSRLRTHFGGVIEVRVGGQLRDDDSEQDHQPNGEEEDSY